MVLSCNGSRTETASSGRLNTTGDARSVFCMFESELHSAFSADQRAKDIVCYKDGDGFDHYFRTLAPDWQRIYEANS